MWSWPGADCSSQLHIALQSKTVSDTGCVTYQSGGQHVEVVRVTELLAVEGGDVVLAGGEPLAKV